MHHLFIVKGFAIATVTTYKTALLRPLARGFGLELNSQIFSEFTKGLQNIRPAKPSRPITWSLDPVLAMLSSDIYSINPSEESLLHKCLFLVALATGGRVSETHAIRRDPEFLIFSNNQVTLLPDQDFLAKNEHPYWRREPIYISALLNSDGSHHTLCPVKALSNYRLATSRRSSGLLFLVPGSTQPQSKSKIANLLCKTIKLSQPTAFPVSHDIRKMSFSLAFMANMNIQVICGKAGWSSSGVFLKHYLKQINDVKSTCVVLGQTLPNSRSSRYRPP